MVAPSAHHSGRTKSAPSPKTVKISQNILRSIGQVYSCSADATERGLVRRRVAGWEQSQNQPSRTVTPECCLVRENYIYYMALQVTMGLPIIVRNGHEYRHPNRALAH